MQNRHAHYRALLSKEAKNQHGERYDILVSLLTDIHDLINFSQTSRSSYFRFLDTHYARLERPFLKSKNSMLESDIISNAANHPIVVVTTPALELLIFAYAVYPIINKIFLSLKGKKMGGIESALFVIAFSLVFGSALIMASHGKKRILRYLGSQMTKSPFYNELQSITGDFSSREAALASIDTLNAFVQAKKNRTSVEINRLFFQACETGDIALVNQLLAKKEALSINGFISFENGRQITPLMTAARHNHPEVVKALLEAGANPNCREPNSLRTALLHACIALSLDCVKLLLNVSPSILSPLDGSDPNTAFFRLITTHYQITYFEESANPPNPEDHATCIAIYKQLLLAAIPKMESDADFHEFVVTAIALKELSFIREICKTASLKKLTGPAIQNALINILKLNEVNAALLLIEPYPTLKHMTLTKALLFRSVQYQRHAGENQINATPLFDLNFMNEHGEFALQVAATLIDNAHTKKLIHGLVKAGAHIEHCTDDDKMTALLYAVKYVNIKAATALIALGANIHHKDCFGLSALDYANKVTEGDFNTLVRYAFSMIIVSPERLNTLAALIHKAAENEQAYAPGFRP